LPRPLLRRSGAMAHGEAELSTVAADEERRKSAEHASTPAPAAAVEKQPCPQAAKAWAWWESVGAPRYHVAPMVDQV
jgi:hypothetical protein